ncbi:MAG: hypothetical protein WA728_09720 [Xanthobacteraceae bacterium]
MAYTVTCDTLGLAIGPVAETTNDVHEALSKARQMYETGLVKAKRAIAKAKPRRAVAKKAAPPVATAVETVAVEVIEQPPQAS